MPAMDTAVMPRRNGQLTGKCPASPANPISELSAMMSSEVPTAFFIGNPASNIHFMEGRFGSLCMEEITASPYQVVYNYFDVWEQCTLRFTEEKPVLKIIIALKGNVDIQLEGIGGIHLELGQFTIVYVPLLDERILFQQPNQLLIFNFHMPVGLLNEIQTIFPDQLKSFLQEINNRNPAVLFNKPGWNSSDIIEQVTYILNAPANEMHRAFFIELKAKTLLMLLLQQKFYRGKEQITEAELEQIWKAKFYIESRVGELLTIKSVADAMNMSMKELNRNFNRIAELTLSEFILKARLNNSKLLLHQTGFPISEIASLCGYTKAEDFIRAFKAYYGITPQKLRIRENKNN